MKSYKFHSNGKISIYRSNTITIFVKITISKNLMHMRTFKEKIILLFFIVFGRPKQRLETYKAIAL
jgi:hypothetical protein